MRKILRFFSHEWFFVFFFSTILISIAFIPYFYQIRQTPPDNIFLGVHNNALDYPMFISEIIQSMRGRWTFLAKFTSEVQPGTLVHPIYIPLGKLGMLLNLSPPTVYQLGRIIFGFTLAFSTYYFIMQVIGKSEKAGLFSKRKLAFLLALFSAGFSQIDWSNWPPQVVGNYLGWWTGGDVLRRAVFQPHAMLKNTLLLLILVWMGKLLTGGKRKYLYYSLPAGLFLGLLDPMNTMTILLLLGIYTAYSSIKIIALSLINNHLIIKPSNHFIIRVNSLLIRVSPNLLFFILYSIFALTSLFYMNWVFAFTPWKAVKDWEAFQFYQVPFWEYAYHIGLTFFLGIPGLLLLIYRKRNIFTYYTLALTIGPIYLITTGITQQFGLSTLRFFQTPVYIFLAITSTEVIAQLFFVLRKIINNFSSAFCTLIFAFCTTMLFLPSIPSYYYSFKNQLEEFKTWYWNIYPDKKSYEAMLWLKDHTPLDSVVLSDSMAGNIIPAVSGNTVYVGHMVSTINYNQKDVLVKKFTDGKMTDKEAKTFLKNGRVDYVALFWGEPYRVEAQNYPFLKKLYQNSMASVYQFIP